MRPIDRGTAPRTYTRYQDAIGDLVDRLGDYCSYCERKIQVSLAVEHVHPKSLEPSLRCTWENFLLACANCNSGKGHASIVTADYFWPDVVNTHLVFDYLSVPGTVLSAGVDLVKSQASLDLTGLNRVPDHPDPAKRSTLADRRWQHRLAAFKDAIKFRPILDEQDTQEVRELITSVAKATGFFSIWAGVFTDDSDMIRRFVEAFPGTVAAAFGPDGSPTNRPVRSS
jgi:hypothetical protein